MQRMSARLARCIAAAILLWLAGAARGAERGVDGNFESRRSSHFVLLQDVAIDGYTGARGSRRFERDVLAVLEQAWRDVSDALGIEPRGRTRVVVYDAGVYDREFARLFQFRSAGFFDGAVHVRAGTAVDQPLASTLQHEYVHAALAGLPLPAWLGEGIAEYFERPFGGRGPTAGEVAVLRRLVAVGRWIPLEQLSTPTFAGLDEVSASAAYLQSLALATHLMRLRGERAVGRMCRDLARSRVERAMQRQFGLSPAELEQAVIASYR
jgi:hypothetical protein